MTGDPSTMLIVYGSLAPGECNHHVIAHIPGRWVPCTVTARLAMHGGYKVLTWDADASPLQALLFTSPELPENWPALDEFEGDAYRRILVPARVGKTEVIANVYAAR